MSRSLHSSTEYFGGSKRWSRNDRDIVPLEVLDRARSPRRSPRGRTADGTSSRPASAARLDPGLPDLVAEQPVEAVGLQGEEVRDLERLADLREARCGAERACRSWGVLRCVLRGAVGGRAGGARGGQEGSFRGLPDSLRARMPDDPGQLETAVPGQVRWQRKATAYPPGTPVSSGPPLPSRTRDLLGRPPAVCHGPSRMDPPGAVVKAPRRIAWPKWGAGFRRRPGRRLTARRPC